MSAHEVGKIGDKLPPGSILFLALLAGAHAGYPQDCSTAHAPQAISSGDVLQFAGTGVDISGAIDYWDPVNQQEGDNQGCVGYGVGFPEMSVGGSGGIGITVQYINGASTNSSGSCGRWTPTINGQTGMVTGGTIEIWREQSNGVACNTTDTLAHEIGHVLGLADATDPACAGHIMGARPSGGTRSVAADDCDVARSRWTTTTESEREDPTAGDGQGPCAN